MLPTISPEQQQVITELENNHNVIVNSVAGSGKTTSNLHIAQYFSTQKILLLTYNAKLKIETREKIDALQYKNIETHSYHSFCVKYYDSSCYTDSEIIALLKKNTLCKKSFHYDLIILDEAQDISPVYFRLICKIFQDNQIRNPQMVVLGDEKQSIFDFNKADQRFLTLADQIFLFNDKSWKTCKLSQSFRITFEMSEFINHILLKSNRIVSKKISQVKPRYVIGNSFGDMIFKEIEYYLEMGYFAKDIFILTPSINKKEKSPIRILENKLVFSTFHQSKGLERKVVLVINFDNSYFQYYKKKANPFVCPNELYVATTRSLEHLSLIHHYENEFLPFLNVEELPRYCTLVQLCKMKTGKKKELTAATENQIAVCDLMKHLPQDVLDDCYNMLNIETIKAASKCINIPVKTKQRAIWNGSKEEKEEKNEVGGRRTY